MATQVTNYQCPACTGPLHFAGALGKLECEYCGTAYDVAEIEALYAEKEEKAQAASEQEAEKAAKRAASGAEDGWDAGGAGAAWSDEEAAGLRVLLLPLLRRGNRLRSDHGGHILRLLRQSHRGAGTARRQSEARLCNSLQAG